jgi:isopentenyl phosphate kinase
MRKPLIIIKLGGSALTDKTRIYTPRAAVIRNAAKQVAHLTKTFSIVLVHGAGSYGHIPAKKWKLADGLKRRSQLTGLSTTKVKLMELETILTETFLAFHIPTLPLSSSDFVVTSKGRISSADLRPIKQWLSIGCVPSLGGDLVTDTHRGFAILSGDQLAAHMAMQLKATRLIFATDVDGIFDSNPKLNRQARLLKTLSTRDASKLTHSATITNTPDVTGGMAGKIIEAIAAAKKGVPVDFVNLTRGQRLKSLALGRTVPCTRIVPD